MRFLAYARIPALALLIITSFHSTAGAQTLPAPVLREAYPLSEDAPRPDPNPDPNPNPDPTPGGTVNFTEDTTTDIRNPERGFYRTGQAGLDSSTTPDYAKFYDTFREVLTYDRVSLQSYANSDHIPASFIARVKSNLAAMRGTGLKAVIRFTYGSDPDQDATKARQLNHIADVKSIFTEYADVIAYVEAGFIGQFGEWHDSRYIGNDPSSAKDVQDMTDIANAILDSVPPNRMVGFRAPRYMMPIFGKAPSTPSMAFNGTDRARVFHHVDGAFSNKTHGYTIEADHYAEQMPWMAAQTANTLFAGEPNGVGGSCTNAVDSFICRSNSECSSRFGSTSTCDQRYSGCAYAKAEAAKVHLTALNDGVNWYRGAEVIQRWKNEGCYDEIKRRMGYRLVLKSATFAATVNRGQSFGLQVTLNNDGFGRIYNPRTVYATLKSSTNRRDIALTVDPRRWDPGTSETFTEQIAVPNDLPAGIYELDLWLPDASNTLRNDSKYAIRLANNGTWNQTLGLNKLGAIEVK